MAALQYAAAAEGATDLSLIAHASEVTSECLQPSLTAADRGYAGSAWIRNRWKRIVRLRRPRSRSVESTSPPGNIVSCCRARRAARTWSSSSSRSSSRRATTSSPLAGWRIGWRRDFPSSIVALRLQGFAAMRADDPAPAVGDFSRALALMPAATSNEPAEAAEARRELQQGLWRARILSGDAQEPLAQSRALAEHDATPANMLNYALLLLAAHQDQAAVAQLEMLARDPESQAVALRLLGLVEFQSGELDAAAPAISPSS